MADPTRFSATAAGTSSGASATITNTSDGQAHERALVIDHISGHTDVVSIIQILDEDDSTVLWESKYDPTSSPGFTASPFVVNTTKGNDVIGKVVSSTSDCQVNIGGYLQT